MPVTPKITDWAGKWARASEAEIEIFVKGDTLDISGDATYGARDPVRVKSAALIWETLRVTRNRAAMPRRWGRAMTARKAPPASTSPTAKCAFACSGAISLPRIISPAAGTM